MSYLINSKKNNGLKFDLIIAPVLIILLGIGIGLYLQNQVITVNDAKIETSLEARAIQISGQVKRRLELYVYGIQGLRGAVASTGLDKFDYQAMQQYMFSRNYIEEFPGTRGIGLIKLVEPDEKQAFVELMKHQRPDNTFKIRQLTQHDKSLFVIQYIEPELSNREAVGLDIGSEITRRKTALSAVEYNQPQLTGPITLVQANEKARHGFLILVALYKKGKVPEIARERFGQLAGWAYSPLLVDEVLHSLGALEGAQQDDVALKITDITDKTPIAFYAYGDSVNAVTRYHVTRNTKILGRQWQISLIALPAFIDSLNLRRPLSSLIESMVIAIALAFSVFSFHLIWLRKTQLRKYKLELAQANEKALAQANAQLEQQVFKRTRQIAQANALQRSILTAASYAVIATDEKGTITLFNPAAEQLLGYKADELIGCHSPAIFHLEEEIVARAEALSIELGEFVEPGFESFVAKVRTGVIDVNQWTYVRKNGDHVQVRLSVTKLSDENNTLLGFLGIAYDLTEQLNHEQALSNAKELAEKATQAKSEFLANMSHEIRTPMNGLYGTLQLLADEKLSEKGKDLQLKAIYSMKSLKTIINDILDFSKIEVGKLSLELRPFNFLQLEETLRSECSVIAADNNISLTISHSLDNETWIGDEVRIRQIFLNLISNAIKFTEKGGVTVTIEQDKVHKGIRFSVLDTGIGMSEEAKNNLFQRFEQADKSTTRKYGGTGIGLAITQSLVTLMNGTIKVKSELGKGSTFTVFLPLESTQEKANVIVPDTVTPDLRDKVVLVAEDNKINQVIVKAMLGLTGAKVDVAVNGKEAVDYVHNQLPDLIFMDIQMPEMDGVAACKLIKAFAPEIPIIALTANVFAEDRKLYKRVGFDGFLPKPLEKDELFEAINQSI